MTAGSVTMVVSDCPMCHKHTALPVNTRDYERWRAGTLAQVAFPYLSPAAREQLISGYCADCWETIWSYDDDE